MPDLKAFTASGRDFGFSRSSFYSSSSSEKQEGTLRVQTGPAKGRGPLRNINVPVLTFLWMPLFPRRCVCAGELFLILQSTMEGFVLFGGR